MVGTVVSAEAPGIPGDTVRFVVLPDGTLIASAAVPDGVLFPIAEAIEATVETPYEVEAKRIAGDSGAPSATEVETLDVKPGSPGQELTYSRVGGVESATVDGRDERLPPEFGPCSTGTTTSGSRRGARTTRPGSCTARCCRPTRSGGLRSGA